MEAIDQGAVTTSQVGDNVVVEVEYHILHTSLLWSNNLLEEMHHSILPQKVMLMIQPVRILIPMLRFGRHL